VCALRAHVPAAGVRVPRPHGSGAAEERPTSLRGEVNQGGEASNE